VLSSIDWGMPAWASVAW